jgi:putative endonuclease
MPDHRRTLGAQGEALAAAHLAREGYRIVGRNVRADGIELDLVAARGGLHVFVEVKTRRSRNLGLPEEAVDARKRGRLVRGAAAWLREHRVRAGGVRFDVITVERSPDGRWTLRHLPGAFDASRPW